VNNYFVIERESSSVERIKKIFHEHSNFNFVGNSNSYDEAMNSILKYMPNLIFIDLDNTINNPFSFVQEMDSYTNKFQSVIGLSSTKSFAYEAIKHGFLDYLVKPFSELELRKFMLKPKIQLSDESVSTVCLKSYKDYQYLNTKEILFLKADNNTTDFHMKDGNIISAYKTLKTFEELLPNNFLRIHKSYIINSEFVSRINYGKFICTINKCIYKIPFTKTYIKNIELINKTLAQTSYLTLN